MTDQLVVRSPHTTRRRVSVRVRGRLSVPALIAGLVLLVIVVACVSAPLLAPYGPKDLGDMRFAAPGGAHLMGTDDLGRDIFSRVLYGGRTSLEIAVVGALISIAAGAVWGMVAAFARGVVDEILMRVADVMMAVPQILLGLIFVAAFGSSPTKMAIIVGVLLTPITARLVRSSALSERSGDYYLAAIAYGSTLPGRIRSEVWPNLLPAVAVQFALNVASCMIIEASLSFIGVGLQDPDLSWGLLVQFGFGLVSQSLWVVTFPTLMIFVTIWMLNILVDELDPAARRKRIS